MLGFALDSWQGAGGSGRRLSRALSPLRRSCAQRCHQLVFIPPILTRTNNRASCASLLERTGRPVCAENIPSSDTSALMTIKHTRWMQSSGACTGSSYFRSRSRVPPLFTVPCDNSSNRMSQSPTTRSNNSAKQNVETQSKYM